MSDNNQPKPADNKLAIKTDENLLKKYQEMLLSIQMNTYAVLKWTQPIEFLFEIHEAKMNQSAKFNTVQLMLKGNRINNAQDNEGNDYVESVRTILFCPQSFQTQMVKQYGEMSEEVLKSLRGQILFIKFTGESEYEGQKFKSFFIQFQNPPVKTVQEKLNITPPVVDHVEHANKTEIKQKDDLENLAKSEKDEAFVQAKKKGK